MKCHLLNRYHTDEDEVEIIQLQSMQEFLAAKDVDGLIFGFHKNTMTALAKRRRVKRYFMQ